MVIPIRGRVRSMAKERFAEIWMQRLCCLQTLLFVLLENNNQTDVEHSLTNTQKSTVARAKGQALQTGYLHVALLSLIPLFPGKRTWRREGTQLCCSSPCPMGAIQEQISYKRITRVHSVSELCSLLISATCPPKAWFREGQSVGIQHVCWLKSAAGQPSREKKPVPSTGCLHVDLWSQRGTNNEAGTERHLSDQIMPCGGTGIVCQNANTASMCQQANDQDRGVNVKS